MLKSSVSKKVLRRLGLCLSTALLAVAAGTQTQSHARSHTAGIVQDASVSDVHIAAGPDWLTIEENLIIEHSRIRQNPQSYIPLLESYLASMDLEGNIPGGCGRHCTMLTQEGRPAVEEAIEFLRNQSPVGPVNKSSSVANAAKAHAADQLNGATGHNSSDGSSFSDRLDRFGIKSLSAGENIAYGPTTAQAVMMNLIIDDGVASRAHRTTIFADDWTVAGAGCGPHATYRTVCVINYAAEQIVADSY